MLKFILFLWSKTNLNVDHIVRALWFSVYGLGHHHCSPDMSKGAQILSPSSQYIHQRSAADSGCLVLVDELPRMSSMPLVAGLASLYSQLFQVKAAM